jgi:hypothetical protein
MTFSTSTNPEECGTVEMGRRDVEVAGEREKRQTITITPSRLKNEADKTQQNRHRKEKREELAKLREELAKDSVKDTKEGLSLPVTISIYSLVYVCVRLPLFLYLY